jgi:hypothetical protein
MGFLSVHQLAFAACLYQCYVTFFWALLVQVTAPTPHTTGRLLAINPNVADLLAVATLRETSLSFIRHYPVCSMGKARQFEVLDKVIRKRRTFTAVVPPAGDRRVVYIVLTPLTSKLRFTNPSEMPSAGAFVGLWDLG